MSDTSSDQLIKDVALSKQALAENINACNRNYVATIRFRNKYKLEFLFGCEGSMTKKSGGICKAVFERFELEFDWRSGCSLKMKWFVVMQKERNRSRVGKRELLWFNSRSIQYMVEVDPDKKKTTVLI